MWIYFSLTLSFLSFLAWLSVKGCFYLRVNTKSPALRAKSASFEDVPEFNLDGNVKPTQKKLLPPPKLPFKFNRPPGKMPDMNNPLVKAVLSNPEMMLSMMPESSEKQQMKVMLDNPMFKEMIKDPKMLEMAMKMGQNKHA